MEIERIIMMARELEASDIHISEGTPLILRIHGMLKEAPVQPGEETRGLILALAGQSRRERIEQGEDQDFAFQTGDGSRQRVNIFRYQGKLAATIRLLNNRIRCV